MEHKHTIKLSTGKEIELTDAEYKELKSDLEKETTQTISYPAYIPHYPDFSKPTWEYVFGETSGNIGINCCTEQTKMADNNYGINGLYRNDSLTKEETANVNRYIKSKKEEKE